MVQIIAVDTVLLAFYALIGTLLGQRGFIIPPWANKDVEMTLYV